MEHDNTMQCMTAIVQHNLTIVDNYGAQLAVADKKGALFLSFSRTAWRMVGKGEYIGSIAQKITGSNIATAYIAARRLLPCILRGGEYIAALSKRHGALQEPTLALVRSKKPLFIFDALCSLVFRSLLYLV